MSNTTSNVKRNTAIGLTAGLLGGGAIGLMLGVPGLTSAAGSNPSAVVAQEDTPTDDTTTNTTTTTTTVTDDTTVPTTPRPTTMTTSAPNRVSGSAKQLQELVDNGTLTSEQADTVAAFLVENRPERDGPRRLPRRPRARARRLRDRARRDRRTVRPRARRAA